MKVFKKKVSLLAVAASVGAVMAGSLVTAPAASAASCNSGRVCFYGGGNISNVDPMAIDDCNATVGDMHTFIGIDQIRNRSNREFRVFLVNSSGYLDEVSRLHVNQTIQYTPSARYVLCRVL